MHCTNCGKEIPDTTRKGLPASLKWAIAVLTILIAVVLVSNAGGVDQKKYDVVSKHNDELVRKLANLTGQNKELLAELEELRQTDQGLWKEASLQSGLNQWEKVETALDQLIANWPKSPLISKAMKLRVTARNNANRERQKQAKLEAERLKLEAERRKRGSSVLELTSFSWSTAHGYATVEGMVKNISSAPIDNVQAVAIFSDKGGNFITSADALIDYRPILPGQSSPFKVMKSENPAMKSARMEFKQLMGGELETYHNWKR